jgi:hypothetical protein
MTEISLDINIGRRAVLEGHFYILLGRLNDIHLNNAYESNSFLIGYISPLQRPISWCFLRKQLSLILRIGRNVYIHFVQPFAHNLHWKATQNTAFLVILMYYNPCKYNKNFWLHILLVFPVPFRELRITLRYTNRIYIFFVRFPNLFAICIHTFKYNQQIVCWEARVDRGVLCSTPPL